MNKEVFDDQKIAIIGMSCRLPGANNISEFWKNLENGVESISTFTDEELRAAGISEELINSPNYIKRKGIIGGAEYFDASFFNITPRDAEIMDPQHRIFLECAWHALEDGGYDPDNTSQKIGVFGGSGTNWHLSSVYNNEAVKSYASGTSMVTANDKDYLATRVSYMLNLTGPSLTMQSACSTSMSAIVMGVGSLLSQQCDMVLAGGSTIELPEKKGYLYQEGGLESSDGHCRAFDEKADGTVFSRGAGVVLLKRYVDAVRDGDHIHGVILGGAINNDGKDKIGFTAPSLEGQVNVAIEALELSGIEPSDLTYVEAHGTATNLGDPIEVSSLKEVFETYTDKKQFCALGSVKTNIGHTDSASGVAGLIKVLLAMKNKKYPAHIHFSNPNPKINLNEGPFFICPETTDWNTENNIPRRALVNSFGVGGTNACVVIEEGPSEETARDEKEKLIMLSARSEQALLEAKENLNKYILENNSINSSDLAYTLQIGRKKFEHREVVSFKTLEELSGKLNKEGFSNKGVCTEDEKPIIFMFPGQGNQYLNMGLDLYNSNATYRQTFDYCCDHLKLKLNLELRDYIFAVEGSEKAKMALEQTWITQPAIFVVSYAMAKTIMEKGVMPEAMIGHSVGEYVAACLSGVITLEDALVLVAKRGELVQKLPGGSMLAVLENEDKILPFLTKGVEVAAVNNPNLIVLAGPDEHISQLQKKLDNAGYFHKKLDTSHAFHSAMMEPCLPEFEKCFENVELSTPNIPIISTVTGKFLQPEEATNPSYWVKHVRKSVRFTDAVKLALDMNPTLFLEVGPGQSLESSVKRHITKDILHETTRTMRSDKEKINDCVFAEEAIGNVWIYGGKIDWGKYYNGKKRIKLSLPVYPYQRKAYSIDFSFSNLSAQSEKKNVRNNSVEDWYKIPSWKRTANRETIEANSENGTWLIFKDDYQLGEQAQKLLKQKGHKVILVAPGDKYKKTSSYEYSVNYFEKEHFEQLIDNIKEDEISINNVLYLRNYKEGKSQLSESNFNLIEHEAFFSILYLTQAMYSSNVLKEIRLGVVANGAFEILGDEELSPEKALGVGTCRVLIKEFPKTRAKFIDVDSVATHKKAGLALNIINETVNDSYETVVAYRNNYRWIEQFDDVKIPLSENKSYKENGIYLITGGLGGIGLLTANTIAENVNASFVLTYSSPIPERGEWPEWLSNNPGDSFLREKIEGVLAIEEKGSKVYLYQVDVSDFVAMKAMKQDVEQKVGKINGIVHSAGSVGGGVIPLKEIESVRPVFNSKFRGAIVLDQMFDTQELDFMLLYSSITSILGEATRLDYCSANAFLDAFAHYRNAKHTTNTTSVNWAGWDSIGMAVRWGKFKGEKSTKTKLRHSKDMLKPLYKEDLRQVYEVNFNPEDDWIINSHFIIGQPTVVGTSFIELVHQYAKEQFSGRTVEMKNLYFMSPLMYENWRPKRVRFFVDLSNGKTRFSFRTQPIDKDPDADIWQDHFIGEIVETDLEQNSLDLELIKQKIGEKTEESATSRLVLYENGEALIDLGERWDIKNYIHVGDNEWLAKLSLREDFNADIDYFDYHPAIMDKATSYALRFLSEAPFLPFSYKSIIAYKKLPATSYAYAKVDKEKLTPDTISIDITMLSADGEILMEIKQYTMKLVNELSSKATTKEPSKNTKKVFAKEIDYINPEEGKVVIDQLLGSTPKPQIIVYPCDFNILLEDVLPNTKKDEENKEENTKKNYYARPSLNTEYEEPETEIEKTITGIWQDILGIDKIGRNDTFAELGGNSLLAIQTIANIVDVLEVELTAQVFYDNPTVKGLAEAVISSIIDLSEVDNIEELLETIELD